MWVFNHSLVGGLFAYKYREDMNWKNWVQFGLLTYWFMRLGGF